MFEEVGDISSDFKCAFKLNKIASIYFVALARSPNFW